MDNRKKAKTILFRGTVLSGGAPRSALQYMKVLKNDGHTIRAIVQGQEQVLKTTYEETVDKVVLSDDLGRMWISRKYVTICKQLSREYGTLIKNKPDFVVILGHFTAYFYSRFCNSLGIPAVVIIAGGDLSDGIHLLEGCPCDHVICFSEENRDILLQCISDERITVIPNRIKLKTVFDNVEEHYNLSGIDSVNILFTSRLDADKYNSVTNFIETASKVAAEHRKIDLTIAGAGDYIDKLKELVASTDNPYLSIEIKGHVDDLIPAFEKAHIVVGKGRSVIEPIMMNRIGCVMGNDGKIEACTTDNFEHLYHYNFSGRNLNCDNPEATLKDLIDSMMSGTFDTEVMKTAAEITRKYYSSEYLADKFHYVLENMTCEKRRKNRVSVLWLIIKLVWIKLIDKIRKGKAK